MDMSGVKLWKYFVLWKIQRPDSVGNKEARPSNLITLWFPVVDYLSSYEILPKTLTIKIYFTFENSRENSLRDNNIKFWNICIDAVCEMSNG